MKKNRFNSKVLLFGLCLIICTGCGFNQQNKKETEPAIEDTEAVAQFQQEQKELLEKANTELAELNKKILTLNDKLRGKAGKLTDAQNNQLDDCEAKRASINQRMKQIKSVSMNDWAAFKASFESDLADVCAGIDKVLAEL
jgi:Skp family chaperone for outer membrane proteins